MWKVDGSQTPNDSKSSLGLDQGELIIISNVLKKYRNNASEQ